MGKSRNFEVVFTARNGIWKQHISLRLTDGEWKMSTTVRRESLDIEEM